MRVDGILTPDKLYMWPKPLKSKAESKSLKPKTETWPKSETSAEI